MSSIAQEMPARTNTLARIPWLGTRRSTPPPIDVPQPLDHVRDAFHDYIHNDIPTRFIDPSNLAFVDRNAVYDVFLPDIARITEEDIEHRMHVHGVITHPEASIYINPRKAALKETIRDAVQYAIFSHRWTQGEPSYKDISTSVSSGRLGFSKRHKFKTTGLVKLVRLCETARSLGYKLIWSDTCCIDKTDPAELSEAIHAMFKWYAHAHLCIVYLAASLSLADFDDEPWFKRGWTLQELLAPKRVKFYNKEWHPFTNLSNDKGSSTLMSILSTVTGIPQDAVVADNSHGIKGRGVWEIMSWASTRKTTRIEDTAYCLFGLFDINIPITYGEGDKAFLRLVAAIAAQFRTWDVFAWAGQASSRNPALPHWPACYSRWDEGLVRWEVGSIEFELTSHELRLMSVPLIPVTYTMEAKSENELYTVTLSPRADAVAALGMYRNITVVCGAGRLQHIRKASDLHACILSYESRRRSRRGKLQVGKTYVCFLLHREVKGIGESTWLKLATENVLGIGCSGTPVRRTSMERTSDIEQGTFDLPLRMVHIRAPGTRL